MPSHCKNNDTLARLFPYNPESSVVTVVCRQSDFAASRMAHAVEDCDAHLLNLNVTAVTDEPSAAGCKVPPGCVAVQLRVSHRNPAAVIRSLARYGYTAFADGAEGLAPDRDMPLLERLLQV